MATEPQPQAVPPPRTRAQVNPMGKQFLKELAKTLWTDPTAAATAAGYQHPEKTGRRLWVKYQKVIERDKLRLFSMQQMTPLECQGLLAGIARGLLPATQQQVKCLELILRVHGMLSDKVDVTMEQSSVEVAVMKLVAGHTTKEQRALTP